MLPMWSHTWLESDDVAVKHFRRSPTCPLASEGMNLSPLSKILLTEILKKLNSLDNELKLLRMNQGVGNKSFLLDGQPLSEDTVDKRGTTYIHQTPP